MASAAKAPARSMKLHTVDDVPPIKRAVSVKTASELYELPISTLRQWINEGTLPAFKINNARVRIYVDDLEALFAPMVNGHSETRAEMARRQRAEHREV